MLNAEQPQTRLRPRPRRRCRRSCKTLLAPTLTTPPPARPRRSSNLVIASGDGTSPPVNVNLLGPERHHQQHQGRPDGHHRATARSWATCSTTSPTWPTPTAPAALLEPASTSSAPAPAPSTGNRHRVGHAPRHHAARPATAPDQPQAAGPEPARPGSQDRPDHGHGLDPAGRRRTARQPARPGITTLLNVPGVNNALNNVLATTVNLVNSASLTVSGRRRRLARRRPGATDTRARPVRRAGPPGPARPAGGHQPDPPDHHRPLRRRAGAGQRGDRPGEPVQPAAAAARWTSTPSTPSWRSCWPS